MKKQEIDNVLSDVKCGMFGVKFSFFIQQKGDGFTLQVGAVLPDNNDEQAPWTLQKGRKWYISSHSIKDEVVGTAFKAILTFVEHELRELFLYRNVAIYNAHVPVDKLVLLIPIAGEAKRNN